MYYHMARKPPSKLVLLSEDLQTQLGGFSGVPCCTASLLQLITWWSMHQCYNLVSEHLFELFLWTAVLLAFLLLLPVLLLLSQDRGTRSLSWTDKGCTAVTMFDQLFSQPYPCFRPWILR